jgi:hypothetical protein
VDENGDPMDPNDPNNPVPGQPPANMNQTAGNPMMPARPSKVGAAPGVAPMPQEQVVPKKLGQAQPGGPAARNSPQPGGAQDAQFNKAAKPPKGAGKMPGAKGPGDPKVANRTKKAQNNSPGKSNSVNRPIHIQVKASASYPEVTTIGDSLGFASLKYRGEIKARGTMPLAPGGALGPSGVMPTANPASGKSLKALEQLSDKEPGNKEHQVAFNPKFNAKAIDLCAKCGKMHAGACPKSMKAKTKVDKPEDPHSMADGGFITRLRDKLTMHVDQNTGEIQPPQMKNDKGPTPDKKNMKSKGHSRGAKKGWSTRGKGHLSKMEKHSHYSTM